MPPNRNDSVEQPSRDERPFVAVQHASDENTTVHNEFRGSVSGVLIQISGDHHGSIEL